jgi:hypothetical protein
MYLPFHVWLDELNVSWHIALTSRVVGHVILVLGLNNEELGISCLFNCCLYSLPDGAQFVFGLVMMAKIQK